MTLRLLAARDEDFAALLAGTGPAREGVRLALPPGNVDLPEVLRHVRRMAERVERDWPGSHWLMVAGDEIVGTIGVKGAPSARGEVEIGYGVAAARRGRGHATAAVAALVRVLEERADVVAVSAETTLGNTASQRVLAKNGFTCVGERIDAEDGALRCWRRELRRVPATVDAASGASG